MQREIVDSTNIISIGYDKLKLILQIEFKDGNIYDYYDVPAYEYNALMAPGSKGTYAHQNIYNKYKFAKRDDISTTHTPTTSGNFTFSKLEIPAVILIEPKVYGDNRGFFLETYQASAFKENGISEQFVQDNFSFSTKNTLRGLHYQKNPYAQGKLVSVSQGEVFDVAVDIRKGSPTFGKWVGAILSGDNKHILYVPAGFAHGFCVLSEEVTFTYKVTSLYAPKADRGIAWNDTDINIDWPIKGSPILSKKDQNLPTLKEADINYTC